MTPRIAALLRQPHLQRFAALPNIEKFSLAEIAALDSFARFLAEHRIDTPRPADLRAYTGIVIPPKPAEAEAAALWRSHWAQSLADLKLCLWRIGAGPGLLKSVETARGRFLHGAAYRGFNHGKRGGRTRSVSVPPETLPAERRATLARLRAERSHSLDILDRTEHRLCMFVWSAEQADLPPDLRDPFAEQALYDDLGARSYAGRVADGEDPHTAQPRWAYLRGAAEELTRFAQAHGLAEDVVRRLDGNKRRFAKREERQPPLKMFLSEQAPSAAQILADALDRLQTVAGIKNPAHRHQARLKACAIGVTIPCPPRARDVVDSLFWGQGVYFDASENVYRYDYVSHKTGIRVRMPLAPPFSPFFDALLLGDIDPRYLPEVRERAIAHKLPLFLRYDGDPVKYCWIGNAWFDIVQSGSHLIRTVLQTELADYGEIGADYGQLALGHAGPERRAKSYRNRIAKQKSAARASAAMAARAATFPDDISDLL